MSEPLAQLIAVLGMLGSAHDGEALNAARLAERTRKRLGKSWAELVNGVAYYDGAQQRRAEAAEARVDALINELEGLRAASEAGARPVHRAACPCRA
jgi:hypothetical protein